MMDDFGDTSISQALSALKTSYGAPDTGTAVGAPSYYGAPGTSAGPPSYYGPPSKSYGLNSITSYVPLTGPSANRWECVFIT